MTGKSGDTPLKTLERAIQSLGDQVRVLPEAGRRELAATLQEVSRAMAALREAGESVPAEAPDCPEAADTPYSCGPILHQVFNAIPDMLTVIDRDFNIVMSNWHESDMVPAEARRGRPACYRVFHHRDRPCEGCHVQKVFATGQPQKTEKTNLLDGRTREFSAFPVQSESGQVILAAEHVRDATERHRAAKALKESEERFRAIFAAAQDAIFIKDRSLRYTQVNPAMERLFDRPAADLIGKTDKDLFGTVAGVQIRAQDRRALSGEVVVEADTRLVQGEHKTFHVIKVPLYDDAGQVMKVCGIARDITDLKQAEAALRDSEEKYRGLIEATSTGYVIIDPEGKVLDANLEYVRLSGHHQLEEILGRSVIEWTSNLDRDRNAAEVKRCFQEGSVKNLELNYQGKAGRSIPVEINATAISTSEGIKILSLVRDITDRKQADEALRERESTLRTLIEANPETLILMDTRGMVLAASLVAARRLGKDLAEIIGTGLRDMLPPELGRKRFEIFQEVIDTGQPRRFEDVRGDFHFDNYIAPIFDQNKVVQLVILGVDITARKQAEEALRESEQRFRLMAETIQDVFWISTPGIEKMVYVSPAYEQVWGRTCQELYQSPLSFLDALHPEDRERVRSESAAGEGQSSPWSIEYRIIQPDGAVRWIHDRGYPVRDDRGRVILFTGVARDITEGKALEQQLLQAQKMEAVGRLAGGVAHDFNNLLMAITGYGELMRAKVVKDDQLYGYLEHILEAGDRAAALTQQLLTFSRQKIIHLQVVDFNRVVLDLEPMLRRLIGEDLDLEVVTDPQPGAVKADPGQMGQIIMNLVVNARDAMPHGGRLTLKTARIELPEGCQTRFRKAPPGAYVMLTVQDTGTGMNEAIRTHAFEPFFTTKEPGKGTGLGLSTVYGIVKQSGGYLDLESSPGAGSTFTIYLPRLEASAAPPQARVPITASFRGEETVLLVEDEEVLRGLLAKFLRLYGYTVLEARHGGEALLLCERHPGPIHVMVTDVVMPNMSGRELVDRLIPLRPEMKIIFMSGYTEDTLVQHGVADLSVVFLQKPFKPIELARRVHAVLHPQVGQ